MKHLNDYNNTRLTPQQWDRLLSKDTFCDRYHSSVKNEMYWSAPPRAALQIEPEQISSIEDLVWNYISTYFLHAKDQLKCE